MVCNESVYIDDITWIEVVKLIAPGICAMPVIRDPPVWWVYLTMDGFNSHVNVNESLTIWNKHKLWVAKEESSRSHVNQPHNQEQAQS